MFVAFHGQHWCVVRANCTVVYICEYLQKGLEKFLLNIASREQRKHPHPGVTVLEDADRRHGSDWVINVMQRRCVSQPESPLHTLVYAQHFLHTVKTWPLAVARLSPCFVD